MEYIFHEKQYGSLCAQHCLNALLQGEYFTAVDLATLAQNMDEAERQLMAEASVDSEEYQRFLKQPSVNMDDSGYFSIQVISNAVKVWNLELIPYISRNPRALAANTNPDQQLAFICNYHDHWFTVRKLGTQWFNLNSLLTGPELISDTHLAMFLAQLQQEGYSVFIVQGSLPQCESDGVLRLKPAVQVIKPCLLFDLEVQNESKTNGRDESQLREILWLSLQEYNSNFASGSNNCLEDTNQYRNRSKQKQLASDNIFFSSSANNQSKTAAIDDDEATLLKAALKLSLEEDTT